MATDTRGAEAAQNDDSTLGDYGRFVGVLLGRALQVTAVFFAVVFVAGPLLGNMAAWTLLVLLPFAAVLLLFVLVVEIGVRTLKEGGE